MKIDNHMHALLPKLDLNIQTDSLQNQASFTSYLIGFSEGLEGSIHPPVNPIGIYPIAPPAEGSEGDISGLSGAPANPILTDPVARPSNPSTGEAWQEITPPVNPIGIYPIAPPSNGSEGDISGLSASPVDRMRIL